MKTFEFQFDSLLKYRRHLRDLCRQVLADVLANQHQLAERREALEHQRTGQLDEIRTMHQPGQVEIDRSAARRYHAGQMQIDISYLDRDRNVVAEQLARCRQALIEADRNVKVLEKLRDKQQAEFTSTQSRKEARELDESWMAARIKETAGR